MLHVPSKLLLSALLIIAARQAQSVKKGQFGDQCEANDFNGCDPGLAVACLTSTCSCIYPWMIYDPDKNKCLSTVNQQCDLDYNVKFLECVKNSQCVNLPNENGEPFPQCICNNNYSPTTKQNCDDPEPDNISRNDQLPKICCPNSSK
ncbi:unnamed protein product [Allacma fusca]|uniref:Secreted protein n=1 Tax=Allacma fusca TaxID=39272 RepID=A0A8J2L9N0_9HEXA|nr:unnamed protein product [Allacma fusca]